MYVTRVHIVFSILHFSHYKVEGIYTNLYNLLETTLEI